VAAKFQTSCRNQNGTHHTRTINPDSVPMSNSQQTSLSTSNSVSHTQQIEKLNRNESRKMHPPASSSWTPTAKPDSIVPYVQRSIQQFKLYESGSSFNVANQQLQTNRMQTGAKGRRGNERQTQQPTTAAASLTSYTSRNLQRVAESGDSGLRTQTRGHGQ